MDDEGALNALSALAHETRLAIVRRLVVAGPGGLSAGEIAAAVGASPSRASFHLSALADAGLIAATRRARAVVYAADLSAMGRLIGYLLTDCCRDAAEARACCGLGAKGGKNG